jgi:hypothetical protein
MEKRRLLKGVLLMNLLLLCFFMVAGQTCQSDRGQESSGPNDEVADDDDNDDDTSLELPDGVYECKLEFDERFDNEFCDSCCSEMFEDYEDDNGEFHPFVPLICDWFIDVSGKTWTVCSNPGREVDYAATCFADAALFCGLADWRLPNTSDLEELRAFDPKEDILRLTQPWLWVYEAAEGASEGTRKWTNDIDWPGPLACFNFETGVRGCTDDNRLPAGEYTTAVYVRP